MKVSFMLILATLYSIASCDHGKEIFVKEIIRFCKDNSHKYLTFLEDEANPMTVKRQLYKSALEKDLRMRSMKWENLKLDTIGNMDTIIIVKEDDSEIKDTLSITNYHKRQKTIIAIPETRVEEFKAVEKGFGKNSYFYLMTYDEKKNNFKWHTFMTFHHSNDIIMNPIHFDENGFANEDYDMQGMEIVATSDNWQPYTEHKGCNDEGRNCENSGLLIDKMKIWSQKFNFTWDIKTYKGDWGMFPRSGPYNKSGVWTGVMGDVVNNAYPLSLNSWKHVIERDPLVDFVPMIIGESQILVTISKTSKVDAGLFIRPFRNDAWFGIAIVLIVGTITTSVPAFFMNEYKNTRASRICIFCLWAFFVPVSAYYKGALKMFFNSEVSLPFETLDQVLEVFPLWNLIILKGMDIHYKPFVDQGVPNYVKYWDSVVRDKASFAVKTIPDGLKKLENDQTVFHVNTIMLKGVIKSNPKLGQNLRTFGKTKPQYRCLMLNKNSPLVPLFKKATLELLEKGQSDYAYKKWIGNDIEHINSLTSDVMGPGQVFLVFLMLTAMLVCSLACLILECIHFLVIKKRILSSAPPTQGMVEVEPSRSSQPRMPPIEVDVSINQH